MQTFSENKFLFKSDTILKKSLYLNVCSPVVCVGVSYARSQQVQIEFGPKDVRAHVLEKSKYT